MPKKRTVVPFYGKINQSLEEQAKVMTRRGLHKEATALFEESRKIHKLRKGK